MNLETNPEPRVPAELADALKANVSLLCDAAVRFLHWSGRKWDRDFDLGAWDFPLGFLAELCLALQLVAWEQRGLYAHRQAGLPSADDAIIRTFASYEQFGPKPALTPLARGVLHLYAERFAWAAPAELGAEVAVDPADEEALLEALADYLWAHRRAALPGDDSHAATEGPGVGLPPPQHR